MLNLDREITRLRKDAQYVKIQGQSITDLVLLPALSGVLGGETPTSNASGFLAGGGQDPSRYGEDAHAAVVEAELVPLLEDPALQAVEPQRVKVAPATWS